MGHRLLPLLALLAGCATEVYQPGKTREQTQRDIHICSEHAKLVAPYNPVSTLEVAYECLEQKGYRRRTVEPVIG
ncbi:MAG TPA: hypothetical protein VGD19_01780 [Allosphingosinicella sp.]